MTDSNWLLRVGGDLADAPFWQGCQEGVFRLHRCERCERCYWPASCCTEHGSEAMAWIDASGHGTLYTYTVMHHAYTPAMKDKVPYVVAVVKLLEGPFYHSNVIDCPLANIRVGMPLTVCMQPQADGLVLPMFKPRGLHD